MRGGPLRHRAWIERVERVVCSECIVRASLVCASPVRPSLVDASLVRMSLDDAPLVRMSLAPDGFAHDALASSSQPVGDSCR